MAGHRLAQKAGDTVADPAHIEALWKLSLNNTAAMDLARRMARANAENRLSGEIKNRRLGGRSPPETPCDVALGGKLPTPRRSSAWATRL